MFTLKMSFPRHQFKKKTYQERMFISLWFHRTQISNLILPQNPL